MATVDHAPSSCNYLSVQSHQSMETTDYRSKGTLDSGCRIQGKSLKSVYGSILAHHIHKLCTEKVYIHIKTQEMLAS